ncbi:MAG: hypothetical protein QXF15_03785 [Candidatus Aenigmatarchaeota archaeon]
MIELSRVNLVENMDGKVAYIEVPKKVENLISKIEIDILPKN